MPTPAPSPIGAAPSTPTRALSPRRRRFEEARRRGREGIVAAVDAARVERGLSYRRLERLVDIRVPTLQGWLSSQYVPQVGMRREFGRLVQALELADEPGTPGGVGEQHWWQAFRAETAPAAPRPREHGAGGHLRPVVRLDRAESARLLAWQRREIADPGERLRSLLDRDSPAMVLLTTCDCRGAAGNGVGSEI